MLHTVGLVPADHQIEGPDPLAWLTAYRWFWRTVSKPPHTRS